MCCCWRRRVRFASAHCIHWFLDALHLGKISVGPPYFETVFVPLMTPVLLLLAVGPFVRWKSAPLSGIVMALRWIAVGTLVFAVIAALFIVPSPLPVMGVTFTAWILLATASHLIERLRHAPAGTSLFKRIASQPRSYWGMLVAHAGIGIFVLGVTMVKGTETSNDVSMRVGDTTTAGGLHVPLTDVRPVNGPNYSAMRGTFEVTRNGAIVTTMMPEKRKFVVQNTDMTEAGYRSRFHARSLCIDGEAGSGGAWVVRVQHKPFVSWIWGGCLIIAFGGVLAASDRRYRLARKRAAAPAMIDKSPDSAEVPA